MNRPNRGRRKRDEPFNPFAKNAIQERNRRQAERAKEQRLKDNLASQTSKPESNNASAKIRSLEEMRKAAQQKLSTDTIVDQKLSTKSESKKESSSPDITPVITNSVAVENAPATPKISREDRLAELKRKSEESKKNAKLQEHVKPDVPETVEVNDSELIQTDLDDSTPLVDSDDGDKLNRSSLVDKKSKNVFKTVTTQKNNAGYSSSKKRKTRRIDKKGGGRQKLEKKLNRQKILEFKYVARDILDNPEVPEEHRSNVLGQIIAKGERISIDSAIEFIDQKLSLIHI